MRKRYVQLKSGELIEVGEDYRPPLRAEVAHNIIPDIKPYRSMIDGSEIGSRSTHREHLRAHGCFEVGNEVKHLKPFGKYEPAPGLKETLIRVANEKLKRS